MSSDRTTAYHMRGPSALGGDPSRFWHLTTMLAVTDFKLRFFGSFLGYLWSLMRPLLLFSVLYVVFSHIVRLGATIHHYPVLLLTAVVLYEYFSEATGNAVPSVLSRENLVRKIQFPRMVIPLSVTLESSFNLLLNFVVVFAFLFATGVSVQWRWIELPFLLALLAVLATGVSMLVSALYVFFRDISPIWEVILRALFYATPVIYPIEQISRKHEQLAHVVMCNPLAAIIQQVRYAVIDPSAPSAGKAIGGEALLLIPLGIIVGVFVLGLLVFNRMAPQIAEEL